jgi:hypothetical protein
VGEFDGVAVDAPGKSYIAHYSDWPLLERNAAT